MISNRVSRRIRLWGLISTLCILFIWLCCPALLRAAGAWLDVGCPFSTPLRYGYILGGGADVRPVTAAALYRAGLIEQILVANPPASMPTRCNPLSEAEIVQEVLRQEGVPATAILVMERRSSSTEEEMADLAQFLHDHDAPAVAVVTHGYHTRRTRSQLYRHLKLWGRGKQCGIFMVSVPTDGYSRDNWWQTEDGLLNYSLEFAKNLRDIVRL